MADSDTDAQSDADSDSNGDGDAVADTVASVQLPSDRSGAIMCKMLFRAPWKHLT